MVLARCVRRMGGTHIPILEETEADNDYNTKEGMDGWVGGIPDGSIGKMGRVNIRRTHVLCLCS